jgi:hypothetical protein
VKALTVWEPWASLIVGSPSAPPQKPVENRDWRPPASLIGERVAIHAGKTFDANAFYSIFVEGLFGPVRSPYPADTAFPRGAIVGVATLDRVIALQYQRDERMFFGGRFAHLSPETIASWGLDADGLRWFVGRFGWVFRDRRHIATPVECKGAQGLWTLPGDVEAQVVEQLARAT